MIQSANRRYCLVCSSALLSPQLLSDATLWPTIISISQQFSSEMEGLKKCCQCFCCCPAACMAAQCIDCWWSARAQGMCTVNCDSCCWTFCAPLCMSCGFGDKSVAGESCMKALKFCGFSCLLCCVAPLDGCYNGFMVSKKSCSDGIRRFKDLTEHTAYFGKRVYTAIGLPEDNEPYQTMETTFRDPS